jgi:hypothetical protein
VEAAIDRELSPMSELSKTRFEAPYLVALSMARPISSVVNI